ncbi:MAG: SigB/SigF/SigG family RNA polymerase sigma factor [Angustibacter sp.]
MDTTHALDAQPLNSPGYVDRLVRDNLPLARGIAGRYRERGEQYDDLVQVACLGLVKAARKYRPDAGFNFAAYAVPTMTGELRRHFRDRGWDVRPPRRLQELRGRLRDAEDVLSQQLGRRPTTAELAEHLEVDAEEVDEARMASEGYNAISLDAPPPGTEASDWAGADSAADVQLARAEGEGSEIDDLLDATAVRPLINQLTEREQLILALRFYGGATQQQIADRIGVTQMQVSRLLSQLLQRLRLAALGEQPLAGTGAR